LAPELALFAQREHPLQDVADNAGEQYAGLPAKPTKTAYPTARVL
jgi:hypothetical protein